MCGRYRLLLIDQLNRAMEAAITPMYKKFVETTPGPILFPGTQVPLVTVRDGKRLLSTATWGFTPVWMKGKRQPPINVRCEDVWLKPMYRQAFEHRRGLMPCDGFFEPKGPPSQRKRQPYFFQRPDRGLFAMAAIWEPDHGDGESCALFTIGPNKLIKPVQDRMPVILHERDWKHWLNPQATGDDVADLLNPAPGDYLQAWRVRDMTRDPDHNVGDRPDVPEELR